MDQRFGSHSRNRKKALKANRKVKTIAGRLVRELDRKLPQEHSHGEFLSVSVLILQQNRGDKHKIYSIHEPQVQCISKGKEHKKYEFGNKVSILYTQTTGVIVGALAFANEYDGHTLDDALKQYERLKGRPARSVYADRGYRGRTHIDSTLIRTPKPFGKKMTGYQRQKQRKAHNRRAAIEPIIGHLKQDHRLSRNFYKGDFGDQINVILAAAGFNFKRMMNIYKQTLVSVFAGIFDRMQAKVITIFGWRVTF